MSDTWTPAEFLLAYRGGIDRVAGYTYRGVGIHMRWHGSPKGRRSPSWEVIHLGSGHRFAIISGNIKKAFPVATALAEAGDWDFVGLDGWRNRDPELPVKIRAIAAQFINCTLKLGDGNADMARAIAMARA